MSDAHAKTNLHALLLCRDAHFLGTTNSVLHQLGATSRIVEDSAQALLAIATDKYEVIVLDWREIEDLAEFLAALRHSSFNHDCVLVAIARDVLDVRQAFAAGVHFLIHKPASVVQIERCVRTAYLASVARRRKNYRAPAQIPVALGTRNDPSVGATIVNLGEGGAGLRLCEAPITFPSRLIVGDFVSLSFRLPGTKEALQVMGRIVWAAATGEAGVQFSWMADAARVRLEAWLTECLERSVAQLRSQLASVCA